MTSSWKSYLKLKIHWLFNPIFANVLKMLQRYGFSSALFVGQIFSKKNCSKSSHIKFNFSISHALRVGNYAYNVCFAKVALYIFQLNFEPDLEITAMFSSEGECVYLNPFIYPKGNVEDWLLTVSRSCINKRKKYPSDLSPSGYRTLVILATEH